MTKIAFLFLTQKEFTQEKLWNNYFYGIDKEKFSIYIHSKPEFIHNKFSDNQIDSIQTEWGKFSIVEAQQKLINESLNDENNTHFIFISESTIPICGFNDFYDYLDNLKNISIFESEKCRIENHCNRFHSINNVFCWEKRLWYTNPQWVLFNREHSNYLKDEFGIIKTIFESSQTPDEHCYSTYLHNKFKLNDSNYLNKSLTFVDWSGHNGTYPSSYNSHEITSDLVNNLKNQGYFFMRKIIDYSPIEIKY